MYCHTSNGEFVYLDASATFFTNRRMALTRLILCVLIMVALEPQYHRVDGEKTCSCYTFEDGSQKNWLEAMESCKGNNKSLVAMETIQEWEFINRTIQNRTTADNRSEWHIGLSKLSTAKVWSWINGKQLNISKWQKNKPGKDDKYALIAREFPPGDYGSFNSIKGLNEHRGWICEEETGTCDGICMHYNPQLTTTAEPLRTTATASAESTRLVSTTENLSYLPDSTAATTISSKSARQDDEKDSMIAIVAASLGAVLFILVVLIVVVLLLRRRRRRGKGTEQPHGSSSNLPPERQYESVQPVEAAKLLGTPDVIKKSPKVECEYAMVNKENRKPIKGDLLYAQLADFDDTNEAANGHKPAPYEPTVYADVVPSDVYHKVTADSSDPTYANVQSTGV